MLQGKSQCGSKLLQALCFRSFCFLCGSCGRSCNFLLELYPAAKVPQADAKATSCLRSKSSCKACTSKFAPAGWRVAKENKWTQEATWNQLKSYVDMKLHDMIPKYSESFLKRALATSDPMTEVISVMSCSSRYRSCEGCKASKRFLSFWSFAWP